MITSAVVTGSSSGIGLATAARLLNAGYAVVINGRDERRLQSAHAHLERRGTVVAITGDAAHPATVDRLAAAAAALGQWQVAVANAGGGVSPTPLSELSAEIFTAGLVSNVLPAALLLSAVAREFTAGGRFVAVASVAAHRGSVLAGPEYSAAKAAVLGLIRHGARELGGRGITVNAVAPGVVDVPRIRPRFEADADRVLASIPIGRLGTPAEIAATIGFLVSPEAGYITGATVDVNGGMYPR